MDDIDASRIMRDFFVQHPHERRGLKSQLPCTQIDEEPNDSATAYQASTGRRSMQPEEQFEEALDGKKKDSYRRGLRMRI
jgi:hypothetical protein